MSKYWRTREAFYQARGEVGAPLISVRPKLVKTRPQVVKEQQLDELQVIKEWQQALKQQYMAQQLVEPQLCKDYYKAEREELRKRQEEPYISIKVLRKIPVQLWLFRSMLFAEGLKEIREEKRMLSTGPFEPLHGPASKRGVKQIYRDLRKKYVVDMKYL